MAMRRPPADVVPPCELARFDPDEWPAPDDAPAPDVSWYPAYERWMAARRAWVKENPDTPVLGDWVDNVFEGRTWEALNRFRPLEQTGPVAITNYRITEGVIDPTPDTSVDG